MIWVAFCWLGILVLRLCVGWGVGVGVGESWSRGVGGLWRAVGVGGLEGMLVGYCLVDYVLVIILM